MEQRNSLTRWRADRLYEPLHAIQRRDLLDNNVDFIVVGDKTEDRQVQLEWSFELPISGRSMVGLFRFVQNGSSVDLDNHYSFIPNDELKGVEFSASLVGDEIRLDIVTNSLGENPTIKYRRTTIGVV